MREIKSSQTFWQSLAFKIGLIIGVIQISILTLTGVIYTNNFNRNIDQRAKQNVLLPATLLNKGLLDLDAITDQIQMRELVGDNLSNAFVIGINGNIFYSLDPSYTGRLISDIEPAVAELMNGQLDEAQILPIDSQAEEITSLAPLVGEDGRSVRFYVYVELSTTVFDQEKARNVQLFLVGSLSTILISSLAIFIAFQSLIFRPLQKTVLALQKVEQGDLSINLKLGKSQDEVYKVQYGFNQMIARLKESFDTLEERVVARTHDLSVSSQVSQQITTVLEEANLLTKLVELTQKSFELDQVSVFRFDKTTVTLDLVAASGAAGQQMLSSGKFFPLEGRGLVPSAAFHRQPFISNDVSLDAFYKPNPLLPLTRAEAAIPIIFDSELLGVLDLQSNQPDRFTETDKQLFVSFANQIAIAIRNALLFGEVEQARQQAERADLAKSAFLASTSHELRTPLNAIINLTSFVRQGLMGDITPRQHEALGLVMQSGQNLLTLINDVLDMSKIESGSLKLYMEPNVHLLEIITNAVSTAKTLLKDKPVKLVVDMPAELPLMTLDRYRIQQILLNLLSNACKFTEEGQISLKVRRQESSLEVSVSDTGPGIPSDDFERIFQKFTQTETGLRQGGGTGLGLPITKSLVEAHHGHIWLESEEGKGATFYILLPIEMPIPTTEISEGARIE